MEHQQLRGFYYIPLRSARAGDGMNTCPLLDLRSRNLSHLNNTVSTLFVCDDDAWKEFSREAVRQLFLFHSSDIFLFSLLLFPLHKYKLINRCINVWTRPSRYGTIHSNFIQKSSIIILEENYYTISGRRNNRMLLTWNGSSKCNK